MLAKHVKRLGGIRKNLSPRQAGIPTAVSPGRGPVGRLNVAGREVPFSLAPGEVFKLQFFFDKSVLEAFAGDGRIAVTRVVYPPSPDLRVELFAEGGTIQVQKLEGYEMTPVW